MKREKLQDVKLAQSCYENISMPIIDRLSKVGHGDGRCVLKGWKS